MSKPERDMSNTAFLLRLSGVVLSTIAVLWVADWIWG